MAKSKRTVRSKVRQYIGNKTKKKTKRSACKRFVATGSGEILAGHSGHSHLLYKKSSSRKRRLTVKSVLRGNYKKRAAKLITA